MSQVAGLSPEMGEMVIQTLRQVVKRELPDERILELDATDEFPHDIIQNLLSPEVGLHLIFLPKSVGGLGGGARDICRVCEEMAAVDLGVATAFLAICLGTDPILVGGTEEQKSYWLGRIASEGMIVAYGVTEPEAGSNVAALQTKAEPITDAAGNVTAYRISGVKQFITNGGVAQLYTILANAPEGPTFFIVERATPGLIAGRKEDKHGIRASNTTGLMLEDMEVPVANLVGGVPGKGLQQANEVFGYTRLMVSAFGLGSGQAAIERALAYAKTREQFGSPLIDKEGYTLKLLVPHWIDLAAGRAYEEAIALRLDEGETRLEVEGSIAKLWCTEAGIRSTDAALQALGGYGYTREFMVEKARRDVRITSIYEGTSEILQSIIGMYRWRSSVRSKGAFYGDMAAELDALHIRQERLGANLVAAALRGLGETILYCHQKKLTRHQIAMFAIADMATHAEVAAEFALKAGRLGEADDREATLYATMSRVFARRALQCIRTSGKLCATGFLAPGDDDDREASQSLVRALEGDHAMEAMDGLWNDMNRVGAALKERG